MPFTPPTRHPLPGVAIRINPVTEEPALQACLAALARDDLPNLWKPRPETFIYAEAFPLLGTGTLDLRHVKDIALQYAA